MTAAAYSVIDNDEWFLVLSKRTGVPVQPDPSGDQSMLERAQSEFGDTLFVTHRIDRPASGLVILGRSREAASRMSALLRQSAVDRHYWAIVSTPPDPPAGTLTHQLLTDSRKNRSRVVQSGGVASTLHYAVAARSDRYWLIDVALRTGRHHQIRAQLASVGCPIRGDLKYGARRSIPGGGIALHAYSLRFNHPFLDRDVAYFAPPPDDALWHALTDGLRPDTGKS